MGYNPIALALIVATVSGTVLMQPGAASAHTAPPSAKAARSKTTWKSKTSRKLAKKRTTNTSQKNLFPILKPQTAPVPVPVPVPTTPQKISAATTASTPGATRALWVWSESKDIVDNSASQNAFFAFIKAPHGDATQRINRIFLSGDSFDYSSTSQKTRLRAFIKRAHAEGVAVEFLTGSSSWVRTSEIGSAYKRVDRMISFNKETSNPAERFDGIHFDIEPYTLSDWKAGSLGADGYNDALERNFVTIMKTARQKITASGQNLSISIDIPTWFLAKATDITGPLTASDSPITYFTIMNYFDTVDTFLYGYGGNSTTSGIKGNLAVTKNIPVLFGANTKQAKSDPETTTFFEEGVGDMNKTFTAAQSTFSGNSGYMGLAVHHYGTYRAMTAPAVQVPAPVQQPAPAPAPTQPVVAAPVSAPAPAPVVASTVNASSRAMWVWSAADDIVLNKSEQDAFFAFIKAPHGDASARINRIFWSSDSIDYTNASQAALTRAFLKRAHTEGVAVEFLTGNPAWARTELMGEALKRVDRMIAFNKGSNDPAERFDGVHLDIEPYLLDEWKSGSLGSDGYNDALQQNYMSVMKQARAKLDASGQKLTLSADVPTWFSSNVSEIWKPLTASDSPVDYITIMNYFDTAATFMYGYGGTNKTGGVSPNLALAGSRPIMFGAETKGDIDPPWISFAQEGVAAMESVFDTSQTTFSSNSRFAGHAVHHYEVYRFMK